MPPLAALAVLAAAPLFLTAACSPPATSPDGGGTPSTTTAPATTAPATAASPPATTTSPATIAAPGTGTSPPSILGAWVSPSCGERTYPRHIEFASDGTFHSEDLVSPCPPNVVCVWSGIVHRKGTYTLAAGKITLTVEGAPGAQGKPLPDTLGVDPTTSAPFEPANGTPACTYSPLKKEH